MEPLTKKEEENATFCRIFPLLFCGAQRDTCHNKCHMEKNEYDTYCIIMLKNVCMNDMIFNAGVWNK